MNRGLVPRSTLSSRRRDPTMLIRASSEGAKLESAGIVDQLKWSTPRRIPASGAAGSAKSACRQISRGCGAKGQAFRPVATTLSPTANSAGTRARPRKPLAPVTRALADIIMALVKWENEPRLEARLEFRLLAAQGLGRAENSGLPYPPPK